MPKKRKPQQRELKPRLHIFCEGEETEPNYLNGYIERCFPGTTLTLVRRTEKNTPVQLVDVAIKEKSRNPSDDQFWVVYDRESSIKYPDSLHDEARDKAGANGIGIAFSNVCFEVWLLLHFQETVEADYAAALVRIEELMDATPGSPDEDELRLLGLLVEHYEQEHYPIGPPTPLEAIEFFMDQNGLSKADMVQFLGSPSKVSEVLNGKRPLSKTMICKLVEGLGIPAEILLEVQPVSKITYPLQKSEQLRVAEGGSSYGEKS